MFQVNEFTNEGVDLAGDYVTGAALTVTIKGLETGSEGAWKLGDNGEWMKDGDTLLGVPAGTHSIIYRDAEGYTKPANGSVTVEDGKDYTASGTYTKA
ncbi:MAG: hypothetical protein LUH63_20450 [Parabacteroides sp.]|nr:hypothetical protein [Parabacteroides sp.]